MDFVEIWSYDVFFCLSSLSHHLFSIFYYLLRVKIVYMLFIHYHKWAPIMLLVYYRKWTSILCCFLFCLHQDRLERPLLFWLGQAIIGHEAIIGLELPFLEPVCLLRLFFSQKFFLAGLRGVYYDFPAILVIGLTRWRIGNVVVFRVCQFRRGFKRELFDFGFRNKGIRQFYFTRRSG